MFIQLLFSTCLLLAAALASDDHIGPPNDIQFRRLPADVAYLVHRALPNSPSHHYAPAAVPCPSERPSVRNAGALSSREREWLELRRNNTVEPMVDFFKRANISGFDAESYVRNAASSNISALPNIAIAVSGGGYRALMNGAGFLKAADRRTTGSIEAGGIGGLLQATTYLSGLSGGGWLVGSMFANNFSSVEQLQQGSKGSSVWKFENSIFEGPEESGISIFNTASYWADVAKQVSDKEDAGFDTSMTDYWGRALSYQLVNDTDGGPAYTFSSIAETDSFQKGDTPFPILVADGRAPNETVVSLNATNFEFNPFETGSFDPTVFGFAPTRYLASDFRDGRVSDSGKCVEGFDQIGYVMGTSSTLFNQFLLANLSSSDIPRAVVSAIEAVLRSVGDKNNDIAQYTPNPFLDWSDDTNPSAGATELSLVDGGEDLQNIPLTPLILPDRKVDVIFAVDSSADTQYNWPNGTALRATYDRSLTPIANGTLFPAVPDDNTFINLGLNNRPTFFGCDPDNFTLAPGSALPPLVVYIPNAPYTAPSNVSTFDPSYPTSQRDDIILNAYNGATQGNGTLPGEPGGDAARNTADWPTCLACAALSRSLHRSATETPPVCADCFRRYCWDGTVSPARPDGPYEPSYKIENLSTQDDAAVSRAAAAARGLLVSAVGFAAVVLAV